MRYPILPIIPFLAPLLVTGCATILGVDFSSSGELAPAADASVTDHHTEDVSLFDQNAVDVSQNEGALPDVQSPDSPISVSCGASEPFILDDGDGRRTGLALSDTHVYYGYAGTLRWAHKLRGEPSRIAPDFTDNIVSIAVGATKLFFASRSVLYSSKLDGSSVTRIHTAGDFGDFVHLATDGDTVYASQFSSKRSGEVGQINRIDSTGVSMIHSHDSPTGVAVQSGYVYWTSYRKGFIQRKPLLGGTPETLADTVHQGTRLAITDRDVYYASESVSAGWTAIDGSSEGRWLNEFAQSIAVDRACVYWVDGTRQRAGASPHRGMAVSYIPMTEAPQEVAVDDVYLYASGATLTRFKKAVSAGGGE